MEFNRVHRNRLYGVHPRASLISTEQSVKNLKDGPLGVFLFHRSALTPELTKEPGKSCHLRSVIPRKIVFVSRKIRCQAQDFNCGWRARRNDWFESNLPSRMNNLGHPSQLREGEFGYHRDSL